MHFQIRDARPTDIPRLRTIEQDATTLFEGTPHAMEIDLPDLPADYLSERIGAGEVLVAVDESDIALGFAAFMPVDTHLHLHELSVHPDAGRQGIGSALVAEVVTRARQAGFDTVTLSTYLDIPWNAPFYRRFGFADMPEKEIGPGLRELRRLESEAGLDIKARTLMRLALNDGGAGDNPFGTSRRPFS